MRRRIAALLLLCFSSCGGGDNEAKKIDSRIVNELVQGQQACESSVMKSKAQRHLADQIQENKSAILGALQASNSSMPSFFQTATGVTPSLVITPEGTGFRIEAEGPNLAWYAKLVIYHDLRKYLLQMRYGRESISVESVGFVKFVSYPDEMVGKEVQLQPYACVGGGVSFRYEEDAVRNPLKEKKRTYSMESTTGTISLSADPVNLEVTTCRNHTCDALSVEIHDWAALLAQLGTPSIYDQGEYRFAWLPEEVFMLEPTLDKVLDRAP